MDSLLANYASSDEEQEHEEPHHESSQPTSKSSTNASIPPKPRSSSLVFSLPPPKTSLSTSPPGSDLQTPEEREGRRTEQREESSLPTSDSSIPTSIFFQHSPANPSRGVNSLFPSLPEPSSAFSSLPLPLSTNPNPRRVVQFKPPINPSMFKPEDDDDEDASYEKEDRKRKQASESSVKADTVKSFFSILPPARNSAALGALPSSASGRRSILEADVPALGSNAPKVESEVGISSHVESHESHWVDGSSMIESNFANGSSEPVVGGSSEPVVSGSSEGVVSGGEFPAGVSVGEEYANYDSYGSHEGFATYSHYESNWGDGSSNPATSGGVESYVSMPGKRRRNEIPTEIIEVKQDELMKNRPRDDQVKSTGIAFGPAYQAVSTKGKPSKLHKRKHQIGSLYFDMRQKETELAERRSKGFLTKSETQAKYGW